MSRDTTSSFLPPPPPRKRASKKAKRKAPPAVHLDGLEFARVVSEIWDGTDDKETAMIASAAMKLFLDYAPTRDQAREICCEVDRIARKWFAILPPNPNNRKVAPPAPVICRIPTDTPSASSASSSSRQQGPCPPPPPRNVVTLDAAKREEVLAKRASRSEGGQ